MATPQSRDLARNGHTPADPGSTKTALTSDGAHAGAGGPGRRGRVPEANQPGHHPDHEQDKPLEAFVAKASALAATAGATDDAAASEAPGDAAAGDAAAGAVTAPPRGAVPHGLDPARPVAGDPPGHQVGWAPPALGLLRLDVAVPAVSLIDAARRPAAAWDEIGESRRAWLTRISLLGPLGAWRYASEVRPRLAAAEAARRLAGA